MQTNNHPFHDVAGEQKYQLLITCDRDGNPTGQATREECHTDDGKTHLAFMAFVYDESGNIWMTKRSKSKSLWGGYWDSSTISHVLPGETVEDATQRRGKEELGIDVCFAKIGAFYYFAKYNGNCENEYCYVLVGKTSEKPHPNPIEIEGIKLIPAKMLKNEIANTKNVYTPWLELAIQKVTLPENI